MGSQSPDMVNSPSHYQLDGFEAIDIIKAALTPEEYRGYLKGNALKYMLREPFKGNSKQDVAKAQWYLERYHALVEFRDKKVKRKTMTKTLADMTAEERDDCVGMWCDNLVSTADNPQPVVLACVQGERCWILHTNLHGEWSCFSLGSVSPRFDLPRAWMPDGQPVPMKKELGFCETAGLETTVRKYSIGTIYVSEDTPHGEVYRWVGEWEQDND